MVEREREMDRARTTMRTSIKEKEKIYTRSYLKSSDI
jgi:hypothetical protein